MRQFGTAREAKEFFANKAIEQAKREQTPLSDLEKKMLLFTESESDARPEMLEWAERIEDEIPAAEYERKIAGLLKRAYEYDLLQCQQGGMEDPKAEYKEAFRVVSTEDHYIRIMLREAYGGKFKKFLGLFQ
jgi:hypothetical protein